MERVNDSLDISRGGLQFQVQFVNTEFVAQQELQQASLYSTPFADKVLYGLRRALRKLVEESAANGESLVIKRDGEIKEVAAKDLLKALPKEGIHE